MVESQSENAQLQAEIREIRAELQSALAELQAAAGNKLKPAERAAVQEEFDQIFEILERLESGKVYLGLFGKTSVGKSAVCNALVGDDVARVGLQKDLTAFPHAYPKDSWMIVDMPGTLGKADFQKSAFQEAKRCHGHIFVIDGEPYGPELDLFSEVQHALPNTPKIVFVNKWDEKQLTLLEPERERLRALISEKMSPFVKSPLDIIYGSAERVIDGKRVRQEVPELIDRMHEDAGTLGMVMNLLNPAESAMNLSATMRSKILEVRTRVARKVISGFGAASVAGSLIPFSALILSPGLLASMVYALHRVMGKRNLSRDDAKRATMDLLKACGSVLAAEFVAVGVVEIALQGLHIFGPLGTLAVLGADVAGLSYFRYRRAVILGEVTLEYIRTDGKWGADGAEATIRRCKERALEHYMRLRKE